MTRDIYKSVVENMVPSNFNSFKSPESRSKTLLSIILTLLFELPTATGLVYVNALGMGVGNRNRATQFLRKSLQC
jgi:hypothetical protein